MQPARSILLTLLVVTIAACSGGKGPSPSPSPAEPNAFVVRATMSQALPPDATFSWLPLLLITADGRLISVGPTDAMFPGKLLPNLLEGSISQAGWMAIANAARVAGLLSGKADFSNGVPAPGAVVAHLQIVIDGRSYDLTGDPAMPPCAAPGCPQGQPGSQLAFAQFWSQLTGLDSWIGPELGNQHLYVTTSYAILVGPPADDHGLNQAAIEWPLAGKLADFGAPIAAGDGRRCGIVSGEDASTLRPALQKATQISPWFDKGAAGEGFGLVVRPLLPGDTDPCKALLA